MFIMKRICVLMLICVLVTGVCSCGQNTATETEQEPALQEETVSGSEEGGVIQESVSDEDTAAQLDSNDPRIIGTWKEADEEIYWRIIDGGRIITDYVLKSTTTTTINGVTTTNISKSVSSQEFMTWVVKDGVFYINGTRPMDFSEGNGAYTLSDTEKTLQRVGDLDFVIDLSDNDGDKAESQKDKEEYRIGQKIQAEGFELVLSEQGAKEDIRVTSNSSGLKITSGPSVENGKKYVYVKGTIKNTGKSGIRAAIGGSIDLDGYEYPLKYDIIKSNGTPASSIDPLETVIILLYAPVSDELADTFSKGTITFGFNDGFANVDINQADYLYFVNVSR